MRWRRRRSKDRPSRIRKNQRLKRRRSCLPSLLQRQYFQRSKKRNLYRSSLKCKNWLLLSKPLHQFHSLWRSLVLELSQKTQKQKSRVTETTILRFRSSTKLVSTTCNDKELSLRTWTFLTELTSTNRKSSTNILLELKRMAKLLKRDNQRLKEISLDLERKLLLIKTNGRISDKSLILTESLETEIKSWINLILANLELIWTPIDLTT